MKILFFTFFTLFFCLISSVGWSLEYKELIQRDGLYYKKFTDVPFTGKITGNIQGAIKNGKNDGEWVWFWDNGQLKSKGEYESMAETYSNFLKVKSLITQLKEEALKYDFITLECDLDKFETASKKISKKNKDLYGTSKQTNLVSKITKEAA